MRDDLTSFEHLHPALAAGDTWTVRVRPGEAGSYRVLTQFTGLPAGVSGQNAGDRAFPGAGC